jgi:hypothetical protein
MTGTGDEPQRASAPHGGLYTSYLGSGRKQENESEKRDRLARPTNGAADEKWG